MIKPAKQKAGFPPSLFGLGGNSTSWWATSLPPLHQIIDGTEGLKVDRFSVVLTIFAAEVDVRLSQNLSVELQRSMKKNPPRTLKYELIYVCCPPSSAPVNGHSNMHFRQGRMSMIQARKRMVLSQRQQVAFFKACMQTWMGEYVIELWALLLTLIQVWLCSHVHCQLSCDYSCAISYLEIGTFHCTNNWYWRTHVLLVHSHC